MRVLCAALFLGLLLPALPVHAQYADTPRVLAAVDGGVSGATQIGRRLFVAGTFDHVSPPTGGAVIVDATGAYVPGMFPRFDGGAVREIVADGLGGWVVVGDFTQVDGRPYQGFARIRPDRALDPWYHITTDGPIRQVRIAHGRVYLLGGFTTINGVRRLGLAALDVASGTLSSWGSAFDPGMDPVSGQRRTMAALSISAIGVYVSALGVFEAGRLWGFDAGSGARLFERNAFVGALAATSSRIYVGSWGSRRPLWAVDPLTGADLPWSAGLAFLPVWGPWTDDTQVASLLLDEGRLYLGGVFLTTDGRRNVAALDAATGQPLTWRASLPANPPPPVSRLARLGPALVAMEVFSGCAAFDVATGGLLPWSPRTYGPILTVAAAPGGAVLGGDFNGLDGALRERVASFDLDTGQLEPWTATLPGSEDIARLDTDGTVLIGTTWGFGGSAQLFKIDPVSGAVLASLDFGTPVLLRAWRVSDGRILVVTGASQLNVITVADWARQVIPLTMDGYVTDIDVSGDTVYLAGTFISINGVSRAYLAALDLGTGAVLPFEASPDIQVTDVRFVGGRLWVGGPFRRIGGARRRGMAELDPLTGRALAWNPDIPGGASLDVGSDGTLFVAPTTTISGRDRGRLTAYSPLTGTWLRWRPALGDSNFRKAFLPDCFLLMSGTVSCYPSALPSPTAPTVRQVDSHVTLSWMLPAGPPVWTGLRVDVGRREGSSELASFTLPADATALSGPVPAGSYFARVGTIGPTSNSLPTPDVSFAVGPPHVPPPPLDPTAVTEGTILTFRWEPPSTGTPAGYVLEAGTAEGRSDVATLPVSGAATSLTIDAPPGRYWGRVKAIDAGGVSAASSELILDVDATNWQCGPLPLLAPLNLRARVTGGTVQLQWEQPDSGGVANTQQIVVGSAPGLDNLGAIGVPGPATSFATTAPPGTYYVRVVALNSCGASPFSNEVVVVVPR